MIIGAKQIKENVKSQVMLERYNTAIEEYFKTNELEDIIKHDFEYRRTIVETIITDIDGKAPANLVYIEYPNNISELDKLGDDINIAPLKDSLLYSLRDGARGITLNSKNTVKFFQKTGIEVPEIMLEEGFVLIGLKNLSDESYKQDNLFPYTESRNYLWTLVHEVFHNYPVFNTNEIETDMKTFDWLLKYDYLDSIGVNYIRYLFNEATRTKEKTMVLLNYMDKTLEQKDVGLFINFLFAAKEIIEDLVLDVRDNGFLSQNIPKHLDTPEERENIKKIMLSSLESAYRYVLRRLDKLVTL